MTNRAVADLRDSVQGVPSAACMGSLALIGLHAFVVYVLPEIAPDHWAFLKRSWGFHFWTFYPGYVALALYAVAIAASVPRVNQMAAKYISDGALCVSKYMRNRHLLYALLCILSWAIFYIGRQKYGLLGDGYLRASDVVAGSIAYAGIGYLLALLQQWLGHWDDSGVLSLRFFSIFWGGPYVVLVYLWAQLICSRQCDKVLCAALMLFIGSIQYFFGYIEIYAPLPVFAAGFLLSGIIALRDDRPPLWATFLFGTGIVMHTLLVLLAPAFLYLWGTWLHRRFSLFRDYRVVCLSAAAGGFLGHFAARQYAHALLPLYPSPENAYAILSVWHVWEWINAQILSAPMGWPVLLLLALTGSLVFCRETGFLAFSALGMSAGLFAINPVLGSRDWDILSLSGVPLMGLTTYAIYNGGLNATLRNYASVLSLVLAALLIIPWVHINHTDRSIARVVQILDGDPGSYYSTHPTEMTLGMYFSEAGLYPEALAMYEQALQRYPSDRRMPFNLAHQHHLQGNLDKAVPYYLEALHLSPDYSKALNRLVDILADESTYIASLEAYFYRQYADSTTADKKLAALWRQLGAAAMESKRYATAAHIYQRASLLGLDNDFFLHSLNVAYLENAVSFLERTNHLSPEDELKVLNLAQFYVTQQDTSRAVQLLRRALATSPENRKFLEALEDLLPETPN